MSSETVHGWLCQSRAQYISLIPKFCPASSFQFWNEATVLSSPTAPSSFHLQFLGQFLITCSKGLEVWAYCLFAYIVVTQGKHTCSRQSQLCNMICLVQLQAIQMHPGPNSSGVASTQLCNMICLVQLQAMHSGPNPKESAVLNCVIWSALYNFRQYRCIQDLTPPGVASTQLCNMICLVQLQAIQMHPGPNPPRSRQYSTV